MTTQPSLLVNDHLAPASNGGGGVLCAVLACPPTTSGARTRGALALAADVLGYRSVIIANLLNVPAEDTQAMSAPGASSHAWLDSRDELSAAFRDGDGVLAAWGVGLLRGPARLHRCDQIEWLVGQALSEGHLSAWSVGGRPKHPSRWHQHVSDRHGRTPAGMSRPDRLRHVLINTPWESLR